MSAPAMFSYDRDGLSPYAPPWARRQSRDALHGVAQGITQAPAAPDPPAWLSQARAQTKPPAVADRDLDPIHDDEVMRNITLRRSLDPQPMPPPPVDELEEQRMLLLRQLGLSAICAVLAVLVVVMLLGGQVESRKLAELGLSYWSGLTGFAKREQPSLPAPLLRLAAHNRSGVVNRPMPLGVGVTTTAPGASVVLAGLAVGTRLTVGTPSGENGWHIPASDINQALIVPPLDFVGTMALAVDLRLADDKITDRNVVQITWTPGRSNVKAKADKEAVRKVAAAEPKKPAARNERNEKVAAPVVRNLGHDEIASLIRRGKDLIGRSDISAARLVLRRAAEGGSARAAFALAASYDPAFLDKIGIIGISSDAEKARAWYVKAAALGSTEAPRHIERLAQ